MAKQQREISVSEFFAKNRHLLGFDNKRKALLTTVKEAVDNSLDACEEAGILADLEIDVQQLAEDRFRVVVRDNGPGIVRQQIPNIFGKLLYGSKFHRLKMARGQQGIGISAAGMYGLITTGKPISIISRVGRNKEAHHFKVAIDTHKNRPEVSHDETVEVEWDHGTRVEIELVASFIKGRQGIGEYIEQTAIANPHARIVYRAPTGERCEYPRGVEDLPEEPREIKPHPYGIELGTLMKMLKTTESQKLGGFLQKEFSRVSGLVAKKVCAQSATTPLTWINGLDTATIEKLYNALQATKIMAPSTDCLSPIGVEAILSGLLKGVKAEFYTASTRSPAVYRGNPFQIEVGLAYGGQLGSSLVNGNGKSENAQARVIRFANRVPLLYRQSACSTFKAVLETKWSNYGVSQPRGALPQSPIIVLIHMASVWVPFTSESKEAIADYDEIRKEIKLALAETARRLGIYLRRKKKRIAYTQRRDVFTRYIHEVVESVRSMAVCDKEKLRRSLMELAERATLAADMEFDEHGKVVRKKRPDANPALADTVIVGAEDSAPEASTLFDDTTNGARRKRGAVKRPRKAARGKKRR
ncbi:MAG: DNA topoisomerase VI subunit B [bacterium]|nr:DNA topoisomerase VI subunit B [bacterium]